MRMTQMMVSAALVALAATALPAAARSGGLLDVGATVGGGSLASADVNANLGGTTAGAHATVGGSTAATASLGTTTGTVIQGSVTAPLATGVAARADVAGAIHAKAQVLGPKRLLKLCVTVGAKGCDGASRSQQIALIDARAKVLSPNQLASACVAVGGSCGAAAATSGGGTGAGNGGGSAGGSGIGSGIGSGSASAAGSAKGMTLASAASGGNKDRDIRITCRSVLASPARYETGLVKLCRKIGQ